MKMRVSEWVSLGHPDKTADYISEYILDRYIEQDPFTRYALEVQIKDNFVTLGGEITSNADISDDDIARFVSEAVAQIGYTPEYQEKWGKKNTISSDDLEIATHISRQSDDIAVGVDSGGWGDQGIMFGMAVNSPETSYMPKDIYLARRIGKQLFDDQIGGLDIKTQVYMHDDTVVKIIVAIPLFDEYQSGRKKVLNAILDPLPGFKGELIVNGTGRYVKHSSMGDCGTTGRKLAADFYGGNCKIGGGSPWTKDGTKADLSLNLLARKMAMDHVKQSGAQQVNCSIACCIGNPRIDVHLYEDDDEKKWSHSNQVAKVEDVMKLFDLRKPVFAKMCREGLFYV